MAGANAAHGAIERNSRFSLTISPQSGVGGWTPRPRNPRPAVRRRAKLTRIDASTATTGIMLGRTSRKMM